MEERKTGGLSSAGAIVALGAAVLLVFVLYYIVGFPANVPAALGSAVVIAELVDAALERKETSVRTIGRALVHGLAAALAAWLGVVLANAAHLG